MEIWGSPAYARFSLVLPGMYCSAGSISSGPAGILGDVVPAGGGGTSSSGQTAVFQGNWNHLLSNEAQRYTDLLQHRRTGDIKLCTTFFYFWKIEK